MRIRLQHFWENVISGYWFLPGAMMLGAVGLASGMLWIDEHVVGAEGTSRVKWLYGGGASGARTVLSAIASSAVTVAGVTFSITIAALTQASSQFGPRLLRNFMRDRGNQVALGAFVSTFVYCLLVLRTITDELSGQPAFVPHASVTTAVLLAIACTSVLVFFIHHVSVSLQAPSVVRSAKLELARAIDRLPEDAGGQPHPQGSSARASRLVDALLPPDFERRARTVVSGCEGYIQAIDIDALVESAARHDLVLKLLHRPGQHVIEAGSLLQVYPGDGPSPELDSMLNAAFMFGRAGTSEQDVEYAIRQMVEVAVRALSPGINDPFTAINCVDALGASLCRIARHGLPGPLHRDGSGVLRVVVPVTDFAGLTDAAFDQIRQHARKDIAVTARLLEVISACAGHAQSPDQQDALLRHADKVYRQIGEVQMIPEDEADLRQRWEAALHVLGADETIRSAELPAASAPRR